MAVERADSLGQGWTRGRQGQFSIPSGEMAAASSPTERHLPFYETPSGAPGGSQLPLPSKIPLRIGINLIFSRHTNRQHRLLLMTFIPTSLTGRKLIALPLRCFKNRLIHITPVTCQCQAEIGPGNLAVGSHGSSRLIFCF